ncbi:UPF0061-domain-containing protein [Martensiomyces pterosporus]|nr:UPF0061-domain-containing protein [Martensiomyces pterosporus]
MAKPLSITALFKREPHLSDEARVELAKTYGLHMDPVGRSDHAVIVAGFVAYSLTALLVLYAWLNRSYRPIRAKNLVLITLILLAGVLWYIGSFVTNGLVNVVGVWKICKLWSIWVRVAFTYMFMCFILFRALALHRIFIQNKPYKGWGYYMPMAIMLAVLLVFCTAAQLISGQKTVVYQEQLEVCMYSDNFRMSFIKLFSTDTTAAGTKTTLRPVTKDKSWIDALQFSDTFTSELPGDKVVAESPYASLEQPKEGEDGQLEADIPESRFRASRKVGSALWSWAVPNHHDNPKLVSVSEAGAQLIGLDRGRFWADEKAAADVWSGNRILPGSRPWAHCYGGHQFGVWAEQLGDGRAISLGEVVAPGSGDRWELQLKGAGRTPYSRFADGYAVRRSSIREYLAAEHLHALGIPTSRSLSLVFTDRPVYREEVELGAIVTRMAPSWVRFGSFELPASRQDAKMVRKLADYVIRHHFPHLIPHDEQKRQMEERGPWNRYAFLLDEVMRRTAAMVAKWQAVGFCHGVMNTDNMSVLGLTVDYGPYAFLDAYDPGFICNHSDSEGRYAFKEQPRVALWNLIRLAGPISVLIDEGYIPKGSEQQPEESVNVDEAKESTVETVKRILNAFAGEYSKNFAAEMRGKFGLFKKNAETDLPNVVQPFLDLLERAKTDYTFAMRSLCDVPQMLVGQDADSAALNAHIDALMERSQKLACDDMEQWKKDVYTYYTGVYRERLADDAGELTRDVAVKIAAEMKKKNPKYILRNWVAQDVIEQADKGNTQVIDQVLGLVTEHAFDDAVPGISDAERFAGPVPSWGEGLQCSCSS